MIIVHDTFICKHGNASKLVKMFKEVMVDNNELRVAGTVRLSSQKMFIPVKLSSLDNIF